MATTLGCCGEPHDLLDRHIQLLVRVVRMRADRAEDVGVALGDLRAAGRTRRMRVEMVTISPTPAACARATTPSRSAAKSGKSRWQ